ncbi:DUF2339 domain-containing protein [Yeosuana marina]|uniref:DUF2339 domain-containing protein n=1 Tax=Yeosuana marina TaxID=1565536 RepID=UPI0030C8294F
MDEQGKLSELQNKLDLLLKKQETFSKEITELQQELILLKGSKTSESVKKEPVVEASVATDSTTKKPEVNETPKGFFRDVNHRGLGGVCSGLGNYLGLNRYVVRFLWILLSLFFGIGFFLYIILWIAVPKTNQAKSYQKPIQKSTVEKTKEFEPSPTSTSHKPIKISNDLEKFIGENLINKIGIAILVIGVAIGTKYSIENNLISPLTRIVLGYLAGLGLLGSGLKLKLKYENFSAVLVSGAMTIMYFITYAAYAYYNLMPQELTFILMFVFTVFTVFAALKYNNHIIALIGLVGAYAVPFLLSDGSGNATILFSYMGIINMGILVLAFKNYWKSLYYTSFALTWLIFFSWYTASYVTSDYFTVALSFLCLFFVIFYAAFLGYKLLKKEQFETLDIVLLLANSFIFYGLGYSILEDHETGSQLLGAFTLSNAVLHFIVSVIIYKLKLADRNLFYLVSGLVLVFITIAIPVQLDGNWVTLLWVGEAALLFWIGRTKQISVYEYLSYPLMGLAVLSLYQDWGTGYLNFMSFDTTNTLTPILNTYFLSTVLFVAAFGFMYYLHKNKRYVSPIKSNEGLLKLVSFMLPAIILSAVYFGLFFEIEHYFQALYKNSEIKLDNYQYYSNYDILNFKTIWLLVYSMAFVSILSIINIKKTKDRILGLINIALNGLVVLCFLFIGLYTLSELRDSYLSQYLEEYYHIGGFNIIIRYLSYVFLALTLLVSYRYTKASFMKMDDNINFSILFHITLLWILSSELINIMDLSGATQSYKLGLSILWGIYSLSLIGLGIWKKQKHLRVAAIVLFSITLIKLFFYDIAHLGTLSKTIVFVSLGILLLIISFLYNKFKNQIADDTED